MRAPRFHLPSAALRYSSRMLRCTPAKRRSRLRLLSASIVLCAAASHAATPDTHEHCVVADRALGCRSERSLIELTMRYKNPGTLQELVQDKLGAGECRLLAYGERVQVTAQHGSERTQVRRPGDKTSYWIASGWSRPASECADTRSAAALHRKLGLPEDPAALPKDDRTDSFADNPPPPRRWYDAEDDVDDYRRDARDDQAGDARYDDAGEASDGDGDDDDAIERDNDEAGYGNDEDRQFTRRGRRPPAWRSRPLPSSRYAHRCDLTADASDAAACRDAQR